MTKEVIGVSKRTQIDPMSPFQGVSNTEKTDSHLLLHILEEMREMRSLRGSQQTTLTPGGTTGYWTRLARTINGAFFIFYLTAVSLFLIFLSLEWNS